MPTTSCCRKPIAAPQVAVAAPGVDILAPAPDGNYQITTGTSVAAAHASGVAALLLARNPKLTPDAGAPAADRSRRARSPARKRDVGAGVIDALARSMRAEFAAIGRPRD